MAFIYQILCHYDLDQDDLRKLRILVCGYFIIESSLKFRLTIIIIMVMLNEDKSQK